MGSIPKNLHAGVVLGAPGVREKSVMTISKNGVTDFMLSIISEKEETKEPFYVLDLGEVTALMDKWTLTLPMVSPFYAVKCNPDPALLGSLAALGSNFDCASRAEIESVLRASKNPISSTLQAWVLI